MISMHSTEFNKVKSLVEFARTMELGDVVLQPDDKGWGKIILGDCVEYVIVKGIESPINLSQSRLPRLEGWDRYVMMIDKSEIPTVHSGTPRDRLIEKYRDALNALRTALKLLSAASPNGRDWLCRDDEFVIAYRRHGERCDTLRRIISEIKEISESL